jgi:CheY-like chemotaxis protein
MNDIDPGIWPELSAAQLLCVDDDPATLQVRKLPLEANGYSVRTATSGAEALDAMAAGGDVRRVAGFSRCL